MAAVAKKIPQICSKFIFSRKKNIEKIVAKMTLNSVIIATGPTRPPFANAKKIPIVGTDIATVAASENPKKFLSKISVRSQNFPNKIAKIDIKIPAKKSAANGFFGGKNFGKMYQKVVPSIKIIAKKIHIFFKIKILRKILKSQNLKIIKNKN